MVIRFKYFKDVLLNVRIEASATIPDNNDGKMTEINSSKSRFIRQYTDYQPSLYFGEEIYEDPHNFGEVVYVVTSTIPSYALYTSTITSTNTNLAVANGLNCIPNGYILC